MDNALGGMREGELVMFTAGSGVGKSTATREIAHSLAAKGVSVGMLCLEESAKQTIQYQMGIELNTHIHLGHDHVAEDDFRAAFEKVTSNLVLWDHWGSTDVDRIESVITHMVTADSVKVIVLDHVSMVISGSESANERKDLDILMTRLRAICERFKILIIGVSHIKRLPEDRTEIRLTDLRGSAALEQLSDAVISFERGGDHSVVRCLKNRHLGWNLGKIGAVQYDSTQGRLVEFTPKPEENKDGGQWEF
jgi:twinkle protein